MHENDTSDARDDERDERCDEENEDIEAEDGALSTEKLLILSLNDENARKISRILSNETARKILNVLAESPMSASELAQRINAPLTTVQYNIERLCDAGLIRVKRKRWSRKMREVKIYEPCRKFVVIATENISDRDVISALKRYLMMFACAVIGTFVLRIILWFHDLMKIGSEEGGILPMSQPLTPTKPVLTPKMPLIPEETVSTPPTIATPLPTSAPTSPALTPAPSPAPTPIPTATPLAFGGNELVTIQCIWFLAGCIFIILFIMLRDFIHTQHRRRKK